jgi:hypothetical protein
MKFRWTIKELDNITIENPEAVKQFIINILEERKGNLNIYAPLYRKIVQIQNIVTEIKIPKKV